MADDANVVTLPSPVKGEGPSRNALRQRRYRKRHKTSGITRNAAAKPAVTLAETVALAPPLRRDFQRKSKSR
jgi:hypothetical protein